jgi:hypothetical protein
LQPLLDANGKTHYIVKFDITEDTSGNSRTEKHKCKRCLEEKSNKMLAIIASLVVKILAVVPTLMEEIGSKMMLRPSSVHQGTLLNQLTIIV